MYDEPPLAQSPQPPQTSPRRSSKKIIITLVALLVVAAGVAAALQLTGTKSSSPAEDKKELAKSVQTSVGRSDNLEVNFEPKTGLASVTQTDPTSSHGSSATDVRVAYVLLVKMGHEMFNNKDVKSIQITQQVKTDLPKNPGNEYFPPESGSKRKPVITEVVTIAMTKANFKSVNWEQYKGQQINKLVTEKSYIYTINPDLKPQLKAEELYLDLR